MRPLDVGIIGAGTAGSAAAVFLARAGHRVTVYERVPCRRRSGPGSPSSRPGSTCSAGSGCTRTSSARGARIDRLLCESATRRPLVDLTLRDHRRGSVRRRAPPRRPLRGADGRRRAREHRGEERGRDRRPRSRARVRAVPAGSSTTDRGRHGPHELVVVADGARSQLRDDTGTSKSVSPYPWGALWFVGKETRKREEPRRTSSARWSTVTSASSACSRPGRGPGFAAWARASSACSGAFAATAWTSGARAGSTAWKDELAKLAPEAVPILDQIESVDQVSLPRYHDVVMHRWTTRNVVYLGDAAHATSPQLGQGCNLALWDAMVLADALAAEEKRPRSRARTLLTRARGPPRLLSVRRRAC